MKSAGNPRYRLIGLGVFASLGDLCAKQVRAETAKTRKDAKPECDMLLILSEMFYEPCYKHDQPDDGPGDSVECE